MWGRGRYDKKQPSEATGSQIASGTRCAMIVPLHSLNVGSRILVFLFFPRVFADDRFQRLVAQSTRSTHVSHIIQKVDVNLEIPFRFSFSFPKATCSFCWPHYSPRNPSEIEILSQLLTSTQKFSYDPTLLIFAQNPAAVASPSSQLASTMATNDFYYGNRPPSTGPSQSQSPYYGAAYRPSPVSTPAPPYNSSDPASNTSNRPPRNDTASPFDTVFDDPAYPTDSTQDGFRPKPYGNSANNLMLQPTPYDNQDTAYYGPSSSTTPVSGRPPQAHFADDIPLQNHAYGHNQPPKDVEMIDHVYDVSGSQRRKKSKKVGFGQLGMFGAGKKRIPWVVYFFTAVQVGVFIGQLVRNGKHYVWDPFHPVLQWSLADPETLTGHRHPNWYTDHDQTKFQPDGWPVILCQHQHGGTICSLYAHPGGNQKGDSPHILAMSQHYEQRPVERFESLLPRRAVWIWWCARSPGSGGEWRTQPMVPIHHTHISTCRLDPYRHQHAAAVNFS